MRQSLLELWPSAQAIAVVGHKNPLVTANYCTSCGENEALGTAAYCTSCRSKVRPSPLLMQLTVPAVAVKSD
jgi:hypothetical protein